MTRSLIRTAVLGAACAAGAIIAAAPAMAQQQPVHFLALGDWGEGTTGQAAVAKAMCASNARTPAAFLLTTGDNFYSPDGTATARTFDTPSACLIRSGLRWRATWGNHDVGGTSTATRLASPRRWYTFAQGPLRVVVLDGNQSSSSSQKAFLEKTLKAATEPVRIVTIHQPPYTAGLHSDNTAAQQVLVPLFRKYGVSLVLSGHNHDYERVVRDGVTYIVTGGGGAQLYPCVRRPAGFRKCVSENHFLEVDAAPSGIAVRAVRPDGTAIESVTVPVRATAPPA